MYLILERKIIWHNFFVDSGTLVCDPNWGKFTPNITENSSNYDHNFILPYHNKFIFGFDAIFVEYWNHMDELDWRDALTTYLFVIFLPLALIGFFCIFIREFLQLKIDWKYYVKSSENLMEMSILFGVALYIISLLFCPLGRYIVYMGPIIWYFIEG